MAGRRRITREGPLPARAERRAASGTYCLGPGPSGSEGRAQWRVGILRMHSPEGVSSYMMLMPTLRTSG